MKIAFIARSTLYTVPGGDTIQLLKTAEYLRLEGAEVDILLTSGQLDYNKYDLLHFFNITRPADILSHIGKTKKPFVLSPILVDYSEYDRYHRNGFPGWVFRHFSPASNEYIKTVSRWLMQKDHFPGKAYLWKGQQKSIQEILNKASLLLPNSETEYKKLKEGYNTNKPYTVVPNGIDPSLFKPGDESLKDDKLILCAARIEGIKNQLNLIKGLNDTPYTLILVGSPAPNQKNYYAACKKIAAKNIVFHDRVSQDILIEYYKTAKVHVLPSWFETCGLSSLEAVAMGCNIVITEKGYTRDYFGDNAFYCDPGNPASIFDAIEKAAVAGTPKQLQQTVLMNYTWQQAAAITLEAYKKIIPA